MNCSAAKLGAEELWGGELWAGERWAAVWTARRCERDRSTHKSLLQRAGLAPSRRRAFRRGVSVDGAGPQQRGWLHPRPDEIRQDLLLLRPIRPARRRLRQQ